MGVEIELHDDRVDVDFTGIDRALALKGRVELPLANIVSVRVVPRAEARAGLGLRVGGSYWPGSLAAGHFTVPGRRGARQLWCVYRDQEVLEIATDLERPARLVLQSPDRVRLAELISARLPRAA